MILVKLFVDDKSLICTDWEIGTAVETAIRNGFKDIRISEPDAMEKINYRKGLGIDDDL